MNLRLIIRTIQKVITIQKVMGITNKRPLNGLFGTVIKAIMLHTAKTRSITTVIIKHTIKYALFG